MIREIIKHFTTEEYTQFYKTLGPGTRSKALFLAFRQSDSPEIVFKKVWKKNYSTDDDYLLRAEKKILKKKIELFIYSNSTLTTSLNKPHSIFFEMSNWCIKNSLLHLSTKYIKKAFEKATEQEEWADLLKINRLWFIIEFQTNIGTLNKTSLLKERALKHKEIIYQLATVEFRQFQFLESSIEKYLNAIGTPYTETPLESEITILLDNYDSQLANYLHLKTLAFKVSTNDPIQKLREAINVLNNAPEFYFKNAEKIAVEGALAMEYSKNQLYLDACKVYEKLIQYPTLYLNPASPNIHFNYLSTLLKLEDYKKAESVLNILEFRHPQFATNPQVLSMRINTYLFLEDLDKLKMAFKHKQTFANNNVKTYYRFLNYLYYLLKGNLDVAEREIINIEKSKTAKSSSFFPLITIFKLYNTYLVEGAVEKKKIKNEILQKINELASTNDQISTQSLPIQWIANKLN